MPDSVPKPYHPGRGVVIVAAVVCIVVILIIAAVYMKNDDKFASGYVPWYNPVSCGCGASRPAYQIMAAQDANATMFANGGAAGAGAAYEGGQVSPAALQTPASFNAY